MVFLSRFNEKMSFITSTTTNRDGNAGSTQKQPQIRVSKEDLKRRNKSITSEGSRSETSERTNLNLTRIKVSLFAVTGVWSEIAGFSSERNGSWKTEEATMDFNVRWKTWSRRLEVAVVCLVFQIQTILLPFFH